MPRETTSALIAAFRLLRDPKSSTCRVSRDKAIFAYADRTVPAEVLLFGPRRENDAISKTFRTRELPRGIDTSHPRGYARSYDVGFRSSDVATAGVAGVHVERPFGCQGQKWLAHLTAVFTTRERVPAGSQHRLFFLRVEYCDNLIFRRIPPPRTAFPIRCISPSLMGSLAL
jgi:hypothetical protein